MGDTSQETPTRSMTRKTTPSPLRQYSVVNLSRRPSPTPVLETAPSPRRRKSRFRDALRAIGPPTQADQIPRFTPTPGWSFPHRRARGRCRRANNFSRRPRFCPRRPRRLSRARGGRFPPSHRRLGRFGLPRLFFPFSLLVRARLSARAPERARRAESVVSCSRGGRLTSAPACGLALLPSPCCAVHETEEDETAGGRRSKRPSLGHFVGASPPQLVICSFPGSLPAACGALSLSSDLPEAGGGGNKPRDRALVSPLRA